MTIFQNRARVRSKPCCQSCFKHRRTSLCLHGLWAHFQRSTLSRSRNNCLHCGAIRLNLGPANPFPVADNKLPLFPADYSNILQSLNASQQARVSGPQLNEASSLPSKSTGTASTTSPKACGNVNCGLAQQLELLFSLEKPVESIALSSLTTS